MPGDTTRCAQTSVTWHSTHSPASQEEARSRDQGTPERKLTGGGRIDCRLRFSCGAGDGTLWEAAMGAHRSEKSIHYD